MTLPENPDIEPKKESKIEKISVVQRKIIFVVIMFLIVTGIVATWAASIDSMLKNDTKSLSDGHFEAFKDDLDSLIGETFSDLGNMVNVENQPDGLPAAADSTSTRQIDLTEQEIEILKEKIQKSTSTSQ